VIELKAFISVDLEGLPFIVNLGQLNLKGKLYDEAREIATKITLNIVYELHDQGFDEIIVADSHGPMVNLYVNELPEYVEIVRGTPRPISMVAGIEECDVALFVGYHAKYGTEKSTFDHTYSGSSIHKLILNGIEVSEYLLNSYTAGEFNVPVIFIAGEAKLIEGDVKEYTPWVESVILKRSFSQFAARSPSMMKIQTELKETVRLAVNKFKENKMKALKMNEEVKMEIVFKSSVMADVADLLPQVKRINGLTVEYIAQNVIEAYKVFQLLVTAASGAYNAIINNQ